MIKIKVITIGMPIVLSSQYVFFAIDLQSSLVFDSEKGLVAKASNHKEELIIHDGLEESDKDHLLAILKYQLSGKNSYNLGSYKVTRKNINAVEEYVKLKATNYRGKSI